MTFGEEYFLTALEAFSKKIDSTDRFDVDYITEAASELCDFLRISRLEEVIKRENEQGAARCFCYYRDGEREANGIVAVQRMLPDGEAAYYYAYPRRDEKWDGVDRVRVKSFVNMFYIMLTRLRSMDETESRLYCDSDLDTFSVQYFFKAATKIIEAGRGQRYSAVFFNIKRLSVINRYYGRQVGTEVMRSFLQQLSDKLSEDEFVCRVGGDNFIAMFYRENKQKVIDHLLGTEISTSVNASVMVSAYAGYYDVEDDCRFAYEIMDKLNPTLQIAKASTKQPYVVYDSGVKQRINEQRYIENIFDDALKDEEFSVYYQPKVMTKDYTLIGAEALCRWTHQGTMIYPNRFIPVLEQNSNICQLDFYMLDHVCKDIRRWLDKGMEVVRVSVNFSRVHLGNVNLMDRIIEVIDRNNVPYEYIEIELTETTTDVDFKELKRVVTGLRNIGISTSVDDFGIGYSSLSLIRDLPWNVLKIDKSFLPDEHDMSDEKQAHKRTMLKYVISMAQSLGLECIVEGVETVEQIALLKQFNCFCVQGYFFDKPMPVAQFEELLLLHGTMAAAN